MVSGPKTLLQLILAKLGTVDTSIVSLETEVKLNKVKLENLQVELKIMNEYLAIVIGERLKEEDVE